MKDAAGNRCDVVDQIAAERHGRPEDRRLTRHCVRTWRELAALVELAIVRKVHLRRDAEDAAAVDDDRAVEQLLLETQRCADDEDRREAAARVDHTRESGQRRVEERVLMEQILVRVPRDAQLGKENQRRARVVRAPREADHAVRVGDRASEPNVRNAHGGAGEPVAINRVERQSDH